MGHKDGIFFCLLLEGSLEKRLRETGKPAQAMFDRIAEQIKMPKASTNNSRPPIRWTESSR